MRPSQTIALISLGLRLPAAQLIPSPLVADHPARVRFEHRAHERNDGKMMLIVTPVRSVVQDQTIIAGEARTYAESYADRTCPKGTTSMATVP